MFTAYTPDTRYAFRICSVANPGTISEDFEVFAMADIPATEDTMDRFSANLRPWALATLTAVGCPFGAYNIGISTLDDDGFPDRPIVNEDLYWSGRIELVPRPEGTAMATRPVTVEDLERSSRLTADLNDPEVMRQAWMQSEPGGSSTADQSPR